MKVIGGTRTNTSLTVHILFTAYDKAKTFATNDEDLASAWKNIGIVYGGIKCKLHTNGIDDEDIKNDMLLSVQAMTHALLHGEKTLHRGNQDERRKWMETASELYFRYFDAYKERFPYIIDYISVLDVEIEYVGYKIIACTKVLEHADKMIQESVDFYKTGDTDNALSALEVC